MMNASKTCPWNIGATRQAAAGQVWFKDATNTGAPHTPSRPSTAPIRFLDANGQWTRTACHSADVRTLFPRQVIYELGPTRLVTPFPLATQTAQIIRGYTLDAPGGTQTSVGVYFCRLQKIFWACPNGHLTNRVQCVDRYTQARLYISLIWFTSLTSFVDVLLATSNSSRPVHNSRKRKRGNTPSGYIPSRPVATSCGPCFPNIPYRRVSSFVSEPQLTPHQEHTTHRVI